jgi:hypothetical protein
MILYDCEILKGIPGKELRLPGIEYCQGWDDFEGMGLACIGVYDMDTHQSRIFCQDNFEVFQRLVDQAAVIIGFNSLGFDNRLCAANGLLVPDERSYDLLVELWRAAGLPDHFVYPDSAGFGLDAVCRANGIGTKSGHGALAPVLWQQGKIGEVLDYCLHDVWLLLKLIERVILVGELLDPRDASQVLPIRSPMALSAASVMHQLTMF